MYLSVKYRLSREFISEEKDALIIGLVGHDPQYKEIEASAHGSYRVLRFLTESRGDAYFEAERLEQLVPGLQIDVEPLGYGHPGWAALSGHK